MTEVHYDKGVATITTKTRQVIINVQVTAQLGVGGQLGPPTKHDIRALSAGYLALSKLQALQALRRTDEEIVQQTEDLAAQFAEAEGFNLFEGTYRGALGPRPLKYWNLACMAQQALTGTDPNDAADSLENPT